MLKKATHWLLLLLVIPIHLFATPSSDSLYNSSFSDAYENCPAIASELLYTSNLTNTFTYLYGPRNIGASRIQFRYRPIGTNTWQLSKITKTTYQFIANLEVGTNYEFQINYECANGTWSDFSESASFTTTGVKSMEETSEEEENDNKEEEEPLYSPDSTSTILKLVNAFASCGDALLCTNIQSINYDSLSKLQFAITWDITALKMVSMETTADIIGTAIWTAQDSMLSNWGIFAYQQDSLPVSTATTNLIKICFSPLVEGISTVAFIDPTIDYTIIVDSIETGIEANNEFVFIADSILTIDSVLAIDSLLTMDSIFLVDSMLTIDSVLTVDSMFLVDSMLTIDSILTNINPADTAAVILNLGLDSISYFQQIFLQQGSMTLYACKDINLGGGTCDPIPGSGLTTSTVESHNAYIYTSQPNGAVPNQFRYRVLGTENWKYTNVDTIYFRRIVELQEGTAYEYQTSQQCSDSTFSDYSVSYSFTTLGQGEEIVGEEIEEEEKEGDIITSDACEPVDSIDLYVSTIKQYFAYVQTPQPYGPIRNQFRYRVVGRNSWFYTSISTSYNRYLMGLEDGQEYEYQASHECENGVWSAFSGSYVFETLPSINLTSEGTASKAILTNSNQKNTRSPLSVYPNPTSETIQVQSEFPFSATSQLMITDLTGKIVKTMILPISQSVLSIDVQDLNAGIYMVQLQSGKLVEMTKFIKE